MKGNVCHILLLSLCLVCTLSGCGKVRSTNSLLRQAKVTYGSCDLVSESTTKNSRTIVVYDRLQKFEYEMTSSMGGIWVDGTNLGNVQSTHDTFEESLRDMILTSEKSEIESICDTYSVSYETEDINKDPYIILRADSLVNGRMAALAVAEIFQDHNEKNRLDDSVIVVYGDQENRYFNDERYGSVKLPDLSWRTPDDELVDYLKERLEGYIDKDVTFVRIEEKTFADTNISLRDVARTSYQDYPTKDSDPVRFCYFETSDGTEYYICDFLVYDENGRYEQWYYTRY